MNISIDEVLEQFTHYNPEADLDLTTFSNFRDKLAACINDLIVNDFPAFIHLLYSIDISESKITELMRSDDNQPATTVITQLIIERQLQKANSRTSSAKGDDIPEDEKW